jgi:hypothetical protein
MSDIFAAQITAVANVVLAVFAIITAILAGLAFRKQSREVRDQAEMLRQATADREREAAERRRAQALQVYVHRQTVRPQYDLDPYLVSARVFNTSLQPVYDLQFRWLVDDKPVGIELWREHLAPGADTEEVFECRDVRPGLVDARVTFRDRAGVWWSMRGQGGRLEEIPEPADETAS